MFNEEENIERAVHSALSTFDEMNICGEVLIIDDKSRDKTPEIADNLSAHYTNVRVIHHKENLGLGAAITTGFTNGRGEFILYMDGDNPFPVAELKKAVPFMAGFDVIAGHRINRFDPNLKRYIYSKVYNWMIRTLFRLKVKDINFSFKLCNRKIFENVHLKSKGSFIDAELLIKARNHGFSIKEIPIEYTPRQKGTSTLSRFNVVVKILIEMVSLLPELINNKAAGK